MNEIIIECSESSPIEKNKKIIISADSSFKDDLLYKFIIGSSGTWETLREFKNIKTAEWVPQEDGKYIIMVQAKQKDTSKAFDYVSRIDFIIGKIEEKLINLVTLDKKVLCIGDKFTLTVDCIHEDLMLRYWCKENENWELLKDYSSENKLNLSANIEGEQEILVECKRIDSKNAFDDYFNIKYEILGINQINITNFALVSDDLVSGCELVFKVEASFEKGRTVLYKFIKINVEGIAKCIQDYSTKNIVAFNEKNGGKYKLLCMAKDMYSQKKYDDRAVLNYEILQYRKVKINGFTSNLSSPQLCDTEIVFKAYVSGGKDLLYRFVISGKKNDDSGFKRNSNFIWTSKISGNYNVKLYVKDSSFKDEFEASSEMDFIIEDKCEKPVVIENLSLNSGHKILLGDSIEAKVIASGGSDIKYSFIVRKDGVEKEKIDYGSCSWAKFTPEEEGTYELDAMIRDKFSRREYDSHLVTYIQCFGYMPANIDYVLYPSKEYYVICDTVNINVITQNTNEVLIKYLLSINGYKVEETEYTSEKKYSFKPKSSGIYEVEILAKNIASYKQFDCQKDFKVVIHEALPVTNTNLLMDKSEIKYGEAVILTAENDGGKNVIYEFYLMAKHEWSLVQKYSRKNFYSIMPFAAGKYKVLVLVKSQYKDCSYEDYATMEFEI